MPKEYLPSVFYIQVHEERWMDDDWTLFQVKNKIILVDTSNGFNKQSFFSLSGIPLKLIKWKKIKKKVNELKQLVVLPGSLINQLQPLCVSIKKPFKISN